MIYHIVVYLHGDNKFTFFRYTLPWWMRGRWIKKRYRLCITVQTIYLSFCQCRFELGCFTLYSELTIVMYVLKNFELMYEIVVYL